MVLSETPSNTSMTLYEQAFKEISKALENWLTADVRTVPGVMYHIRCGVDDNDPSVEYRINYFTDCAETFVHNHRHSFDTLCLEGEYQETTWNISDDQQEKVVYKFYRKSGNIFDTPTMIPGVLRPVRIRHHYPGNQMHVGIQDYHSISPLSSDHQIVTFLRKQKHTPMPDMYVLSPSLMIDAPSDEIRLATTEERQIMYEKLLYILEKKFPQYN